MTLIRIAIPPKTAIIAVIGGAITERIRSEEGRSEPKDRCFVRNRPATGTAAASEAARAEDPLYSSCTTCVLTQNKYLATHTAPQPFALHFAILVLFVIANTPTLGLGHLRAKRLLRP